MICDASFATKWSLENHVASIHEGKKRLTCDRCEATFNRKFDLTKHSFNRHVELLHEGMKPLSVIIVTLAFHIKVR